MNSSSIETPDVRTIHQTVLSLTTADITDLEVEAFVFYARPDLSLGSGFGNAIATRGGPSIKKELEQRGRLAPCGAIVTGAGKMKARYIVHAAGPAFQEENLEEKLRTTVLNALAAAEENGIRQLAFPPMGAGFYGVSLPVASRVMFGAFREYLSRPTSLREVIVCANDLREYLPFKKDLQSL